MNSLHHTQCSCSACVGVRLVIAQIAEHLDRLHGQSAAAEIQERLEHVVRVVTTNSGSYVQILRRNGRVALEAPLETMHDSTDSEQNCDSTHAARPIGHAAWCILRMRAFDFSRSIAQRSTYGLRVPYTEEDFESKEDDEPRVTSGTQAAIGLALQGLNTIDRQLMEYRFFDALPRREIERLLGLSPKAVRWHETRALRHMRHALCAAEPGFMIA